MNEILDTIYVVKIDTITNTEIIYHETVKLIESGNWWSTNAPIIISLLALSFTIGYSLYQLQKERKQKKLDQEDRTSHRVLSNMPLIDFHFLYKNKNLKLLIRNNGLGPAIIKSVSYVMEILKQLHHQYL